MPIPQVPESLAQGVIDGCVVPWEVVPAIKVHELVRVPHRDPGLADALHLDLRLGDEQGRATRGCRTTCARCSTRNSGMAAATMAGKVWDDAAAPARKLAEERGNTITTLSEDEEARWQEATPAGGRGLAARRRTARASTVRRLIEEARALIAKHAAGLRRRRWSRRHGAGSSSG